MHRDVFGAEGDFVTSPEVSQVFGELMGAWAVYQWTQMGKPDPVRLVELGPGRGTLMADALRASAVFADARERFESTSSRSRRSSDRRREKN